MRVSLQSTPRQSLEIPEEAVLSEDADPAEVQKADSNGDVIIWQNLSSNRLSVPELTDYADWFLVDQYSTLDSVARIRVCGDLRYAIMPVASGAGAETRIVIGITVLTGVVAATIFTLLIVPVAYRLLAKNTGSPGDVARKLEQQAKA